MKTLLAFFIFLSTVAVIAQPRIPANTNDFVNDFADVLSYQEESHLRNICKQIESQSSAQVAVVITNSIPDDYPIEQYSIDLANSWGIGQNYKDNGVLILVSPYLRESRIEVGYGLEGVLTDYYTKQLQRTQFNPNFRNGDYYTGIANALVDIKSKIIADLREQQSTTASAPIEETQKQLYVETVPQPRTQSDSRPQTVNANNDGIGAIFMFCLFGGGIFALIGLMIFMYYNSKRKKEEFERNAIKAKNDLANAFDNAIESAKRMGSFSNAERIVSELQLGKLMMNDKFIGKTYEEYQSIINNELGKINKINGDLEANFRIKSKVEDAITRINVIKKHLAQEYISARHTYEDLNKKFASSLTFSISVPTEDFESYFKNIEDLYSEAFNLLKENNFSKSDTCFAEGERLANKIKQFKDTVFQRRSTIESAISFLQNAQTKYNELCAQTSGVVDNSYVDSMTKNDWKIISSGRFTVNLNSNNPITERERIENLFKKIDDIKRKAKNEIDAENARLRRIREASSRVTNPTLNNGYSSHRTSFGGGHSHRGGSSFGGGSFGGGGSSNKW